MANAASRSSTNTDLYIGTLKMAVGLFGTKADPAKTAKFDSAGPNGGVLKYERRGVPAPIAETVEEQPDAAVKADPLADELAAAIPTPEQAEATGKIAAAALAGDEERGVSALVDGEFRQVLVEEGSGEVVEPEQVRKGVRLEDGKFVDCTAQLEAIEARTKLDRIDAVATIDSTQIRRERVIGAYYLGALDDDAVVKMRLLYEGLRKRREVVVVKYTTRSRQQLGVIAPNAKTGTLVLQSLVFAEDWREPPAKARAIQKAEVLESHVEAMVSLLGALHGRVDDLDVLRDDAVALREELRTRAEAGEMSAEVVEPVPVAAPAPALEDALMASVEAVRAGKA